MQKISYYEYLELITNKETFLLDFSAEWCVPCQHLGKVLDDMEEDYRGKVCFYKVDIDEHPSLAEELSIRSVPTLMLFKNGEPVDVMIGAQSKAKIISFLD